jgi:phosphomannomutase
VKALIFDMDGTLTEPRQAISQEMMDSLRAVSNSYKLYLVTGSDLVKVEEQIPVSFLLEIFEKVFVCNGTRVYNTSLDEDDESGVMQPELIHKVILTDHYSQSDINYLISRLSGLAAETHTKYKTGTFVEWRESQINFSLIGRGCSDEQRQDYVLWDRKSNERARTVDLLKKEFQGWGLEFSIGGQISIDITRAGWDKTYAFNHIQESPLECVFFGDKTTAGGNDHEIAKSCKYYHDIESPLDVLPLLSGYTK